MPLGLGNFATVYIVTLFLSLKIHFFYDFISKNRLIYRQIPLYVKIVTEHMVTMNYDFRVHLSIIIIF